MEINEDSYILAYWFAEDHNNNCWYCMIVKDKDSWLVQQTFRHNHSSESEDPFSGKDKKSIPQFTAPFYMKESELVDKIDAIFEFIKIKYNYTNDFFFVRGDSGKFLEIAKTKDYLHFKQIH